MGGLPTGRGPWRIEDAIQDGKSLHDRRRAPRYPTSIPCVLRGGGREENAECIDLSTTGAALSTRAWAAGLRELSIVVTGPSGPIGIDCEVVRTERVLATAVLHVRFLKLPPKSTRAIEEILAGSRAEFHAWQRALAGRAGADGDSAPSLARRARRLVP